MSQSSFKENNKYFILFLYDRPNYSNRFQNLKQTFSSQKGFELMKNKKGEKSFACGVTLLHFSTISRIQ